MIGKTISHYKIIEKLGEGGMGVVYKAQDTKLDRIVALKFLPPHLHLDEEAENRFISEAKAASSFDHPNICTIYDINKTDDDQLFIAMACYEGETLKKKLEKGPIKIEEAIDIVCQVAEGLNRAHQKGIIHRDIKSANIFVTNDGLVKILDFGLAKVSTQPQLTSIGTTMGTVAYMSPEQTKGEEVDQRTDIWSFGVVLYEMLIGELPFKGDYDQAIIYSILNEEARTLSALRAGVPIKLQNIVNMALAKGKEARYRQVKQMLADLRSVQQSFLTTTERPLKTERAKGKRRWSSFKILLSTTVFIVILLLVAHFLTPNFWVKDEMGKVHFTEKSIAILPFENLNSDPDTDPFVLGIHRDLLTRLSQIKGMKVISRTSVTQYTKTQKSIPKIASELGVATVLEGEVQRINDRVRVNVHLIVAQTDEQILWAASFDRQLTVENIFDIQMELSDKIATSLETEFSPKEQQRLKFRHTSSLEAYELYYTGRFHMDRLKPENLTQAIEYFQQALDIDPEFAAAYAGIADCYLGLEWSGVMPIDEAIRHARIATEKALELDPDIAESRSALAHVYLHEMNGPGAEREWLGAIELNPNYQEPHFFLSTLLLDRGRVDEAEGYINKAVELDPLSPITLWIMGLVHMAKNEQAKAIEYYQRIVKSSPGLWLGYYELAWIYPVLGKFSEAIEGITQATANSPENLIRYYGMRPLLAALHAANGNQTDARQLLEELDRTIERPFFLGVAHATLGEIDQAFDLWLKRTRWSILLSTHFRYSPLLDNVRSDPRYPEVLKIITRQWGW